MSKKKILYITQSLGGIETYIRTVVEHIDKDKFEFVVVAPFSDGFSEFCNKRNIKIYNIVRGRETSLFYDFILIFKLKKIIKQVKPDLVHLHSAKAGFIGRIACRMASVKSVFSPHGQSYLSFTGIKRMVYFGLEVFVKKYTDKILAVSYSEAIRCVYEVGHAEEIVTVIPNAIDIPDLKDIKLTGLFESPVIKIGTIARLTYQKNPLLFVEIANKIIKRFPQAEFYILGAGLEDHLKQQTIDRVNLYGIQDKFHILSWATREESQDFLKSLDIFLLTSIFEGLPLSLLEAMALGVPSVTSKCDGCNDVIQNNVNGYACMNKDEFIDIISGLINDKEHAQEIAVAGREYVVSKHNLVNNIKLLETFYTDFDSKK
ncbi:glycosyltransferase [Mucilaginibacter sp. Mucisp86]|uniref:glycosyltransferase n=1 Tax=Mucilaginibacter sp. Mucisp86 TaxID=3243060 RepID=UPI0039B4D93E